LNFAKEFPDRFFDVGICEQHAVTFSAGLALAGMHPVVCIYSTFLARAFDQTIMDVALHKLPVVFVIDRAGVTGPDGASHHGMVEVAGEAAERLELQGVSCAVVNARWVKPIDPRIVDWARTHPVVMTVEDNVGAGGFGGAVLEALAPHGLAGRVRNLALPDEFL